MNKKVFIIAVVSMISFSLFACSKQNEVEEKSEITVELQESAIEEIITEDTIKDAVDEAAVIEEIITEDTIKNENTTEAKKVETTMNNQEAVDGENKSIENNQKAVDEEKEQEIDINKPKCNHNYIVIEKDNTCEEDGYILKRCKNCGAEKNKKTFLAKGHKIKTIIQEPTCKDNGYKKEICKRCDKVISNKVLDKLNHEEYIVNKVESTCTEKGYTGDKKCKRCNETIEQGKEIKPLGHKEEIIKGYEETCTSDGLTDGKKCNRCGLVIQEQEVIEAKHDLIEVNEITPSCTEQGITKGVQCKNCDYRVGCEIIPSLGHTETVISGTQATCTEDGLTEGIKCTRCNKMLTEQKVIKAIGHTEIIDKRIEPTCVDTGLTEGSHCLTCGEVIKEQEIIPATGISVWDGKTMVEPVTESDWLIINFAEELAWVLNKQDTKGCSKIKFNHNIDMSNGTFNSIKSDISEIDGNEKWIANLNIQGAGLIENSNNLIVNYITIKNTTVTSDNNCGILVGNLDNTCIINNCEIIECEALSKTGAYTGGIIGYAYNKNKDGIDIKISSCNVRDTSCDGWLIGYIDGYSQSDNVEITSCENDNNKLNNNNHLYTMNNQSCWLNNIDIKYDNFIANQVYHRAKLIIDGIEFKPRWDGKTAVAPEQENNIYMIYTPFDLAGLREISDSIDKVELKSDIDMYGQGADGVYNINKLFKQSVCESTDDNNFESFNKINYLNGNNSTIYNLKIEQLEKEAGAFILKSSGNTEHKNIVFNNCCTVVTHKQVKSDAKAYGAILIANAVGDNYTASNVKVVGSQVFALQKVGMLIGCLNSKNSRVENCEILNGYIENYECNISERFDSGNKTFQNRTVRLYADFYPQGEVGSLIGFVTKNAKIYDNKSTSCKLYCYGQDDKMATVTGSTLGQLAIAMAGYYKVPGRHVGSLIGDIRATGNTEIKNCLTTDTVFLNENNSHNLGIAKDIGQAYYVKFLDSMGTVTIDGNKITLADCNTDTQR